MLTLNFLLIFINLLNLFLTSAINSFEFQKSQVDPNILEDAHLKVTGLIEKYGYPSETHNVVTHDGYILEMHRIPKVGAKPIFLMHALLDSSSTWVIMGPDKGFAYMLSDLGYDVWMGNARGNRYSRQHKTLDPKHNIFWNFSFHEIGKYDLPAMIDYVLKVTMFKKLHYIGHSQGSTTFWIMCNENPEYVDKIISMQAFAPVAYLKHSQSPLVNLIAYYLDNFPQLVSLVIPSEFQPNSNFVALIGDNFCKDETISQDICANILFQITGFNEKQMNKTMLPVIIGHMPGGAATKQLIHYCQFLYSGKFRQYDYGTIENLLKYGSMKPPLYDLSKAQVKVALHYSTNDWLAEPRDVEKLHQQLPNPIGKFLVDDHDFNHLDFVWGIDARPFLYERVVKILHLVDIGEI